MSSLNIACPSSQHLCGSSLTETHPDTPPWQCSLYLHLRERGTTCPRLYWLLLCQLAMPGLNTILPHFALAFCILNPPCVGKFFWGSILDLLLVPIMVLFCFLLFFFYVGSGSQLLTNWATRPAPHRVFVLFLTASKGCSEVKKQNKKKTVCPLLLVFTELSTFSFIICFNRES